MSCLLIAIAARRSNRHPPHPAAQDVEGQPNGRPCDGGSMDYRAVAKQPTGISGS